MAKLGWVDAPLLKRYRKWAFLAAFIFAAILTPTPDPFNQCLMALPMYIFYEVGIVSAGIFNKKKAAAPEEALVPVVAAVGPTVGKAGPSVPPPVEATMNMSVCRPGAVEGSAMRSPARRRDSLIVSRMTIYALRGVLGCHAS